MSFSFKHAICQINHHNFLQLIFVVKVELDITIYKNGIIIIV